MKKQPHYTIKDSTAPEVKKSTPFLKPQEVTAIVLTILICGIILVPKFSESTTTTGFQSSSFADYQIIGSDVVAYNTSKQKVIPFDTSYFMYYESTATDSEIQRVHDVFQYVVPKIHALSDRYNDYYQQFVYPDGYFNSSVGASTLPNQVAVFKPSSVDLDDSSLVKLNNLRTINQSLNQGPIEIPYDLYNMLSIGKEMTIETNSAYNMFVGTLSAFWNNQNYTYSNSDYYETDPAADTVEGRANKAYLERIDSYVPLTAEEVNSTLELTMSGNHYYANFSAPGVAVGDLTITVGGIAKGYCNEVVEQMLTANELNRGIIFGGQSSLSFLSSYIDPSEPWKILIISLSVATVDNANDSSAFGLTYQGAFNTSTSGGDARWNNYYFTASDGTIYHRHHIIDARTGEPSNLGVLDVNVISDFLSGARMDALTTALMCLSPSDGATLINKMINDYEGSTLTGAWLEQKGSSDSFNVVAMDSYYSHLTSVNNIPISKLSDETEN